MHALSPGNYVAVVMVKLTVFYNEPLFQTAFNSVKEQYGLNNLDFRPVEHACETINEVGLTKCRSKGYDIVDFLR